MQRSFYKLVHLQHMFAQFNTFNTWTEKYKRYDIFDFIACCFVALGIVFFEERTTYLDNALLLFNILNNTNFTIEHGRYLAAIPQIFAVLAAKIGLGIGTVALLLSLGYQLFHFAIYYIIKHRFNQKPLGIVYLSVLMLGMHESLFDLVTETKLAFGIASLLLGFLLQNPNLKLPKNWLTLAFILMLGAISHPVFILYMGIIVLSCWAFQNQIYWQALVVFGLFFFINKLLSPPTSYESGIYSQFKNINDFGSSFLHQYMLGALGKYYKLMLILCVSTLTLLYSLKLKRQLLVSLSLIVGVYFILAIMNANGESHFMIQKTLLPLHFVLLMPLVFVYNKLPNRLIVNIVWPIVLFMSMSTIVDSSVKYTERTEKLSSQLERLSNLGSKLVIRDQQINADVMQGTWALTYETLVIAKWKLNKNITIIKQSQISNMEESKFVQLFSPPLSAEELNPRYFSLPKEPYQMIDSTFMLD